MAVIVVNDANDFKLISLLLGQLIWTELLSWENWNHWSIALVQEHIHLKRGAICLCEPLSPPVKWLMRNAVFCFNKCWVDSLWFFHAVLRRCNFPNKGTDISHIHKTMSSGICVKIMNTHSHTTYHFDFLVKSEIHNYKYCLILPLLINYFIPKFILQSYKRDRILFFLKGLLVSRGRKNKMFL